MATVTWLTGLWLRCPEPCPWGAFCSSPAKTELAESLFLETYGVFRARELSRQHSSKPAKDDDDAELRMMMSLMM
eukprot:10715962-Karenia_brevis.AAC.1